MNLDHPAAAAAFPLGGRTPAPAIRTVDHPSAGALLAPDVALLAGDRVTLTTSAEEA